MQEEIGSRAGEALILMSAENAVEAEQCMRRSVAIAADQGAKSWELRATTDLARLLRDSGRRGEARAMLARNLRLVHRRVRHPQFEGRLSAARRTE